MSRGTAAAASEALALIARELAAITPHSDDAATVPGAEIHRILTICNAQREMIQLGIHTRQMEAGNLKEQDA